MQERTLHVHDLPQHVAEQELAGGTVVVIDVLRATTTICQALASGAKEVVPFLEVGEALAAAAQAERATIVLGGERRGQRIPEFDLGNSPSEYTPAVVHGRRVFLTTTNGTRALYHARLARRVVVGSIVNLSAVVASLSDEPRVDILCAGTDGRETREDILSAGALVQQLCSTWSGRWQMNAAAATARHEWEALISAGTAAIRTASQQLASELRDTPGGRNLVEIGLEGDLVDCAQIDRLKIVPELDVREWRIIIP